MLGKLGQLKKMKKALAKEEVVVEERDVRVVMSGDQKIKELEIGDASEKTIAAVINKAIKKSQIASAMKLQEMSGGLSGLLGK